MSGTAASQIIALAVTPILTRNYSPSDFGFMLTYMSIFGIVSSFVTGKYERALLLARSDYEIRYSSTLCLYISLVVGIVSFLTIVLGNDIIINYFGVSETLYRWLLLFPIFLVVFGINLVALTFLNYKRDYKKISSSRIIKTLSGVLISLLCILFMKNVGGLILGEFFGYVVSTLYLFSDVKGLFILKKSALPRIRVIFRKYRRFPIYNIPSDLLNVASSQMPAFFLSSFFGVSTTGFYSLMKRVLDAPIALFSSSILEVFRQKASEQYVVFGSCRELFIKTARNLMLISILPFLILFACGPWLFSLVFGKEWHIAGEYARIFSVFYFFKFVSSPLSYMFYIAEKQRADFILHLYMFISTGLIFYLPKFYAIGPEAILWIYCINFILIYLFYLIYSYILTKKES